jgi:hypothetical protein
VSWFKSQFDNRFHSTASYSPQAENIMRSLSITSGVLLALVLRKPSGTAAVLTLDTLDVLKPEVHESYSIAFAYLASSMIQSRHTRLTVLRWGVPRCAEQIWSAQR